MTAPWRGPLLYCRFIVVVAALSLSAAAFAAVQFNVRDFGAKGDGVAKDTADFHVGAGAMLKGSPDKADYNPLSIPRTGRASCTDAPASRCAGWTWVEGGTFAPVALTPEQRAKIELDVEADRNVIY